MRFNIKSMQSANKKTDESGLTATKAEQINVHQDMAKHKMGVKRDCEQKFYVQV